MKDGRPTKYSQDMLKKANEYIDSCIDEFVPVYGTGKNGEEKVLSYRTKVHLPKSEGLALYLDVNRSTIYEWAKEHQDFSNILDKINKEQANRVIDNALSGDYNPLIAKLLLGKHGYKDQVGLSGEGEGEGIKLDVDVKQAIGKVYGRPDSGSSEQS